MAAEHEWYAELIENKRQCGEEEERERERKRQGKKCGIIKRKDLEGRNEVGTIQVSV